MDERYVEALKALAEPSRLRLYWLLVHVEESVCVAEAVDVLGISNYNASRILKTLQRAGLVTARKDGKWVFYSLRHGRAPFFAELRAAVRAIPAEGFVEETRRCRLRLSLREDDHCVIGPDSEAWRSALVVTKPQ